MFKVDCQQQPLFEMEVESSESNMVLSSCFYFDEEDEDEADGGEEDDEDIVMAIDSIRSSISGAFMEEDEEQPLSSSLPSLQFANFSITSTTEDSSQLMSIEEEIEETLTNIVEEAAQHLSHHCHFQQERQEEQQQQQSLNEATGVRRRLEPILEEETADLEGPKSSSILQSPSRKALGNLGNVISRPPASLQFRKKLDFSQRQTQHWTTACGRLDGELPIPKVRRTMSAGIGGFFPAEPEPVVETKLAEEIPSFSSTRDAIPRITTSTLCGLLDGTYSHLYDRLLIIDARYPYEYAGGHLPGAVNICGADAAEKYLFCPAFQNAPGRLVVVFHCEFSSERAPRMALHVRGLDRSVNLERYPHLHFPNLYILEGGYKSFFQAFPQRCDPPGQYMPMRNPHFKDELRFHQRMKQLSKEKVLVGRRDSQRSCIGLRKSASAFLGRERATQLTREFYATRDPSRDVVVMGEGNVDFPSSDGPDVVQHGTSLFHQNCFN